MGEVMGIMTLPPQKPLRNSNILPIFTAKVIVF